MNVIDDYIGLSSEDHRRCQAIQNEYLSNRLANATAATRRCVWVIVTGAGYAIAAFDSEAKAEDALALIRATGGESCSTVELLVK